MKQSLLPTTICTLALTLTACGGGSSSSNDHTMVNNTSQNVQNTQYHNQTTPSQYENNNVIGEWIGFDYLTKKAINGKVDNSGYADVVIINGKTIVGGSEPNAGEVLQEENNRFDMKVSNHLSYARYGWAFDKQALKEYMFAQGHISPLGALPTAGHAIYNGHAIYTSNDDDSDTVVGTSRFDVNFGDKKLDGQVSFNRNDFMVKADILGSEFQGEYNGNKTKGRFFGPHGEEIAGGFINQLGNVVFGASKQ